MTVSTQLFRKKPIAQIQAEANSQTLKRTLGPLNLISLGIACIIGAGIFVMTGTASAQHAGPAIVYSFMLAGLACAFTGLCYAELTSMLPISGSAYTYSYATLGEFLAWVMGCLLLLEYGVASATVAVGWSGYLVSFFKEFGIIIPPEFSLPYGVEKTLQDGTVVTGIFNVPAFLGMLAVTSLLIVGVKESAFVMNIMVVTKLIVIVLFVGVGLFFIDPANWTPFIPDMVTDAEGNSHYGFHGVVTAAGIIFFSYIGFEAVSTAAQEAKNPQRDVPIGILGSLFICTAIYIVVSMVLTGVAHYSKLNVPDPIAVAVDIMSMSSQTTGEASSGFKALVLLVKLGALMGLSSVMLVTTYSQTRVFYVMSRDGLLPPFFSKVHERFKTPYLNTMFVGTALAFAAALTPISVLGHLVSMGTLTAFAVVCFSVLYLRQKEPGLNRPFRTPFMPVTPILGIFACGYIIWHMEAETFRLLGYYLAIGIAFYFVYSLRHSKLKEGKAGPSLATPPLSPDPTGMS
ncbi:MAG: amino acid permease [Alphaproteobacteria bacterium]|nr:amino acid permease [Alphaproteobacteria bacterium]